MNDDGMARAQGDRLQRSLLIHLLEHRGQQVRFEADQWTTEFGILRKFSGEEGLVVKQALRSLEMSRWIYRRVQYVIGYSEPKLVYSLTPSGHRKAIDVRREENGGVSSPRDLLPPTFGPDEAPPMSEGPPPPSTGA
ncbi:MAG: hypothetical protein L3K17_04965 [Thermoplasmata archaeon]|nr:hypothetical protein [Thermoplasmata archaeon]